VQADAEFSGASDAAAASTEGSASYPSITLFPFAKLALLGLDISARGGKIKRRQTNSQKARHASPTTQPPMTLLTTLAV